VKKWAIESFADRAPLSGDLSIVGRLSAKPRHVKPHSIEAVVFTADNGWVLALFSFGESCRGAHFLDQ
jgi:hypothetical protein